MEREKELNARKVVAVPGCAQKTVQATNCLFYYVPLPFANPVIARVTLEMALGKEFDYLIPDELDGDVAVGARVKVPFSNRQVLGCVTALLETSPRTGLRSIIKMIGRQSMVTPRILELARWMAEYYCCAPEISLRTVLPEAVRREKPGWREQLFARALPYSETELKLSKRQAEILAAVRSRKAWPLQELVRQTRSTAQTLRRLEDKGLLQIAPQISERDPYARDTILPTQPLTLNDEQRRAVEEITRAESSASEKPTQPKPVFLLHGVTGSGKTEVYLQSIAAALQNGKGAIVLVPEISLTPQTVERFKARFSSGPLQTQVAVLHCHLSTGERHDEWHKIRQGRARIVIGARSAVFAPVDPLGLIVVDEEHEHSYKQEEAPRYHARDVAVVRGRMENAVVVLGTATPSMESFFNAQKGKYRLLELPVRADEKKMPIVRIVDMRQAARREKAAPTFSQELKEAIHKRLDRREQTLLFLNRRGFATSLQCPLCGYVAPCPNCSLALTYHRQAGKLRCHICGHDGVAPAACPNPKCRNPAIRFAGIGTERVEATLGKLFPQARVKRMDSDTLQRKDDYRHILEDFRTGKIDILVGTQMIAKGLHFPNVTLVGIIYADLSLHMPDFRAGERTFQLLTQVAGRAGRGEVEGEVFVQAFTPFHPAIQYARRHDFAGFYEQEIEFRRQLKYPPSSRIALLLLKGRNDEKVKFSAAHVSQEIQRRAAGLPDLIVAGPAPAPLARAETNYRHQIMLRTRQISKLSLLLGGMMGELKLPDDVKLSVDIDPMNLM
jgi:primosomal protein N' (replication factor Y)